MIVCSSGLALDREHHWEELCIFTVSVLVDITHQSPGFQGFYPVYSQNRKAGSTDLKLVSSHLSECLWAVQIICTLKPVFNSTLLCTMLY